MLLTLAIIGSALACGDIPGDATCHADWDCERVFNGYDDEEGDINWAYGGGLAVDDASFDSLYFVLNRVIDIDDASGTNYENRASGLRWDCDDNDCACPTEEIDPAEYLEIRRPGFQANTAPSIAFEHESTDAQLHVMAMEETTTCSGGDNDARLKERVFSNDFTVEVDVNAIATDPVNCDARWTHGLIGFNYVAQDKLFAGFTMKLGLDEVAMASNRDLSAATWGTPVEMNDEGVKSDHIAFDFDASGATRAIYHDDDSADDLDFGTSSSDIDVPDTAGANWPALVFRTYSTDTWVAAFADTSNGNAAIYTTECVASADCSDVANWDPGTTPALAIERPSVASGGPENVRALEFVISGDGTQHLLWVDYTGGTGVKTKVWYSRKCVGGSWSTPIKPYYGGDYHIWLDIGRPHMAVTVQYGVYVVHTVFAAMDGPLESAVDGDLIWAHSFYTSLTCD